MKTLTSGQLSNLTSTSTHVPTLYKSSNSLNASSNKLKPNSSLCEAKLKAQILRVVRRLIREILAWPVSKSFRTAYNSRIISGKRRVAASVIVDVWPRTAPKITLTRVVGLTSAEPSKSVPTTSVSKPVKMSLSRQRLTTLTRKCIIRTSMT